MQVICVVDSVIAFAYVGFCNFVRSDGGLSVEDGAGWLEV